MNLEFGFVDACSRHGQEIAQSYQGDSPRQAVRWPDIRSSALHQEGDGALVARLDGQVVARAWLECGLYPFAELENFNVVPHCQRRGIGRKMVAYALARAARLGYLAVHLQTTLDNLPAHRLYAAHGFLMAQTGQMLRMLHLLNYPALTHFLDAHPLALLENHPWLEDWKRRTLRWSDPLSEDHFAVDLYGGSCQGDSDGYAPALDRLAIRAGADALRATLQSPATVRVGEPFSLTLTLHNDALTPREFTTRLLLNHGCAPVPDNSGVITLPIDAGSSSQVEFPVCIGDDFNCDFWKTAAYPSVATGIECHAGVGSFWLVGQVKIAG